APQRPAVATVGVVRSSSGAGAARWRVLLARRRAIRAGYAAPRLPERWSVPPRIRARELTFAPQWHRALRFAFGVRSSSCAMASDTNSYSFRGGGRSINYLGHLDRHRVPPRTQAGCRSDRSSSGSCPDGVLDEYVLLQSTSLPVR